MKSDISRCKTKFELFGRDIRAPAGIQTQQLGLNVDSLETAESSWGRTSVCQSRCIHGNQINTQQTVRLNLSPGPGDVSVSPES
ncbi:hypothetical protein F2P81_010239 [Scophthalmus maximus]|uniref:Uncharacterized protein n=1 Tax=Scophthalmus maximus TaxID=52904 RepID=A0A6A4SXA3_SCOMX|nr:hypothetical protein F2P81_010239 [Scophthalmus maximus]